MLKKFFGALCLSLLIFLPQGVGVGTSPNLKSASGSGLSTLDDATLVAYWKLDELSGTRAKTAGSCASCDLTAVNAPLARGGVGGYGLVSGTTNAVRNSTATELQGLGVNNSAPAWTIASWTSPTGATAGYIYGNYAGSGTTCSFATYYGSGYYVLQTFRLTSCIAGNATSASNVYLAAALNTRNLVVTQFDPTAGTYGTAYISVNAGTVVSVSALADGGTGTGSALGIGTAATNTNLTGTNDSAMVWKGRLLSASDITDLYNSGKGYTCSALPAALRTTLTACWDLEEVSGTRYASTQAGASCTTNCDMTAVNTPTRATGLVQNSMGMSGNFIATSNQSLTLASPATDLSRKPDWQAVVWFNLKDLAATRGVIGKDDTVTREWGLITSNTGTIGMNIWNNAGALYQATSGTSVSANEWGFGTCWTDSADNRARCSLNNGTAGVSGVISAPYSDVKNVQFQSSSTGATNLFNGSVDSIGIWGRKLTASELTALYASGAGVEYPWTSIAGLFVPNHTMWADLPRDTQQRLIYAKTGVFVPSYMFPSRKVVVVR